MESEFNQVIEKFGLGKHENKDSLNCWKNHIFVIFYLVNFFICITIYNDLDLLQ